MITLIASFVLSAGIIIYGIATSKGKQTTPIAVVVLIAGIALSSVVTVPAGHVGVLTLFGKVDKEVIPEGLHLINPLKEVHPISIRTKEVFQRADVPSKEGLSIGLEVSLLYHVEPSMASKIYREIGENYEPILIVPMLRSAIRNVTVYYEAKALYTSGREVIAGQIFKELSKKLAERGIVVESVLLRKITLPEQVQQAINNKLAAEQEAERMKFVILKEKREAERKRIEAQGIADFQNIIRRGIDERYLKWKALESVNLLAKSPNAKFIILGDKSGLPIIVQP